MTFALYRFGLNLGATVAPLLGLGLFYLAGHQFDLVFWGEALIALCYAVLAWVALPPKAKDQDRQQKSDAGPADRRRTESAGVPGAVATVLVLVAVRGHPVQGGDELVDLGAGVVQGQ